MSDPQNPSQTRTISPHKDPVTGHFLPGNNANPGGRPKADEVRRLLMDASPKAAKRLVELSDSKDLNISLRASDSILDRSLGKPSQSLTGADGGALQVEHFFSERTVAFLAGIEGELADDAGGEDGP